MSSTEVEATWEGLEVAGLLDEGSASRECPGWCWASVESVRLGGDPLPEALWRVREHVGPAAGRVVEGYCALMRELPACVEEWFLRRFDTELARALGGA